MRLDRNDQENCIDEGMSMNVLVVGGAGYVGSHTVRLLNQLGYRVWVYDNLCKGHRQAVPPDQLVEGELNDRAWLQQVMLDKEIDAIVHFAAFALVGESMQHPALYYQNNVVATLELLEAMRAVGVWRIVFSSTTATYGQPDKVPISEDTLQQPINPYGFSKLVIERALSDYSRAYGFGTAALRYFNAAGASADGSIGEDHDPESHLIPIVLQVALGQRPSITVFGDDYPTPDGTCIRDYVHVEDLATAHVAALNALQPGSNIQVNLGTGIGNSVLEIVEACRKVTGHEIPIEIGARRPGDPAELVADVRKSEQDLQWKARYTDIEQTIATAWNWHRNHPNGYGS